MTLRSPKDIILKDGSTLQSRLDSGNLDLRCEDLSYARLDHANLNHASLVCASLNHARLDGACLNHASLDGAYLDRASLDGASLNHANLNNASLDGACLNHANLVCASLRYACLDAASLNHARLDGASLDNASLNNASLDGACLNHARLDHARLNNARYTYKGISSNVFYAFSGVYKYIAMPMIAEDGEQYVRLGCHIRKRTEWESDFWNNDNEFPDNGSLESMRRVMAFELCCKWLDAKVKEFDV